MATLCPLCRVPEHERCRGCGEPVWFSPIWLRRFDAHGSGPHWCAGDRAEVAALGPLRTGIECVCGAHIERDDDGAKFEYGGEPHACPFRRGQQVPTPAAPAAQPAADRAESGQTRPKTTEGQPPRRLGSILAGLEAPDTWKR